MSYKVGAVTTEHKGGRAKIEFDEDDQIIVGRILSIRDVVGFHGSSVKEIKEAFIEAVEDYLAHCKDAGKEPCREYSGRLNLRIKPDLHRRLAGEASRKNVSLNELMERMLASR